MNPLRLPLFSPSVRPSSLGRKLRVDSGFPGGNAKAVRVLSPAHVQFAAAAGTSPLPLWFYFSLEGAAVPEVRCDLTNADGCFGPAEGWRTARPVYSADGEAWRRVPAAEYLRLAGGWGALSFQVPIRSPRTRVAFCYPYTARDLHRLLAWLPAGAAEVSVLARSGMGRPVPLLRFGGEAKRSVWVVARQHAGESPASWVVEGLARELAAGGTPEGLDVYVAPMVDLDGVEAGAYGKDQLPIDFNRDWRASPRRPEIAALVQRIAETAPLLALDLHASHNGDRACYAFGAAPGASGCLAAAQLRFAQRLSGEDATIGFRPADLRPAPAPPGCMREYLQHALNVPVLTLEISYHLSQSGRYLTLPDYLEYGRAIARAITAS